MTSKKTSENPLYQLENILEEYLVTKAPFQIPDNGKEAIVKFLPWIIVIFLIPAIGLLFTLLGLTAFLSPFAAFGGYYAANNLLYVVLSLAAAVLEIIALPGLFKPSEKGWRMLFYSNLVSLIAGIVGGSPIAALVFSILSFYILFQIKEKYN
jgi:hypothetical protein